MLTPFSSGVTPTASLKTNSSDQRMSPAFTGAQPLGESQAAASPMTPSIGLEPEALLANVKTETATALNRTVLQTLAAAVAARMGVDRLPDELLEAFFIRLAAAIERKSGAEQGKIETRAGLKALQIPLSDLAPALRDPSGPAAARLTAKAEAPMAAPEKTAAAGITDSYLQTGSVPARSAETVAMSERNRLSTDNGNLLFQSATPRHADPQTDNASQTQLRTLFEPDAAGFGPDAADAAPTSQTINDNNTVARRGAGPAASGQERLSAVGPDLPRVETGEDASPTSPALSANLSEADDANAADTKARPDSGSASKSQPVALAAAGSDASPAKPMPSDAPAVAPKPSEVLSTDRLVLADAPPLDTLAVVGEKTDEKDLQQRLFSMLTTTQPATETDATPLAIDRQSFAKGLSPTEAGDMLDMTDAGESAGAASDRSSRSRDVIGSLLLPSATTASPAEVAQRAAAAPHLGVPFGYVTAPPLKEAFEADKAEDSRRGREENGSTGDDAEGDAETPEERRERLAREAVDRLLQPEPEQPATVTVNRDSSEADRAFAYYQRLAGF